MTLGDVGEFGLIERIARLTRAGSSRSGTLRQVVLGIGDDAAVLRPPRGRHLAATTDALVEGVHFRWDTHPAGPLGARALAVNLSDLAAMGARPLACLVALAAPPSLSLARALGLARGLLALADRTGCPLVGGNVTRARHTALTVSALGSVRPGRALTRAAARPGDRLLVTGTLGGAALTVARAEREGRPVRRVPEPRLAAGAALARPRWTGACIDLSDGLLADLGHVLAASGVGAEIDAGELPLPRGLAPAARRLGLDPLELALEGGEDYELLFTVRPGGPSAARLGRRLGVSVSEIGRITRRGLRVRGAARGRGGWRHF